MQNYYLTPATKEDIEDIMKIEDESFDKGVGEKKDVFLERIEIFPNGFLLLKENKSDKIVGYIATEIWKSKNNYKQEDFKLNHDIKKVHNDKNDTLYISSMGTLISERGKGLGKFLFSNSIEKITKKYKNINKLILIVSQDWTTARKIYKKKRV